MTHTPRIFALIVAAGVGRRAGGDLPKQYAPIDGKAMLRYAADAFASHPAIAGVQLVIHPEHVALYGAACAGKCVAAPVLGGAQRADSVRAGLAALAPHDPDFVMIHDAARPFLGHAMIDARSLLQWHRARPCCLHSPVADTVRRSRGLWHEVSRSALMRMQTPQCFPYRAICEVLAGDRQETDEAAVWLAVGSPLRYVEGDEDLRKVTTAEDARWAEKYAQHQNASARRVAIGMGYDVHALMPSGDAGVIRLGGIDIANAHKLHGHSDADVVLHAIVDALLGTIAAGDIGSFFPPTDDRWRGANSAIFIEEARAQVAARGGVLSHLDITIIGEKPKIAPHRNSMRESIARLLQVCVTQVSVKATTTEKLGFTGREEGIACQVVATVSLPVEGA